METLRWFMGHTDAQHLWHYITESTPGETIRSVAAEWAAYGVRHGTREAELLGAELAIHFGTSDFSVLEDEALVLYLEDLMEEGKLRIEPEFLDGGRNYRIAVVVRGETTVSWVPMMIAEPLDGRPTLDRLPHLCRCFRTSHPAQPNTLAIQT